MNRAWLFTILGVCAAGLTAGFGIRPLLFPEARITIYPSEIEFKEGHIEGESLETHFELKNESSRPITVTSVRAFCGCMVVAGKNGSLTTPFTLENGAIFPVTLGVATGSRTGPNSFYLSVTAQGPYGTPAVRANATVRVNLLAGLRTEPSAVIFRRVKTGHGETRSFQAAFTRRFGDLLPSEHLDGLISALDQGFFLDSPAYAARMTEVREEFLAQSATPGRARRPLL